ncbi:MAG: glycosyltransferase [Sphingobacteriia bacterium]|jgi:glycosyltransferase involved in cell wall biosynthesis|nr:glycosyltransferase [Sphingobacteriia bacterium]
MVNGDFFLIWYKWLLVAVFIAAFSVQLFFYLYYYTAVIRRSRLVQKGKVAFTDAQPPVSIIVCAKNEVENLAEFLPLILEQEYPKYEVIVINDGSTDESEFLLNKLRRDYSHLYVTSIPEDAKIISRKKLGVTIGIKAAHYDTLLFTDADCRPLTAFWIANMVRNFDQETDFVLGYGAYLREKSFISKLISYDTLFIALQYFGFAFRGKPYMGVGRNLAYKKELFYRLKGFAGILHVASGDDDLLVNEAATKSNTRIETEAKSITLSVPKRSFFDWISQKQRHLSASQLYTHKSKALLGIEPISRCIFYLTFIVLMFLLPMQFLLCLIALFLVRYIVQLLIVNISAKKLKERHFFLSLPFFDIILPLFTLYCMTIGKILNKEQKNAWK